MIVPAEPEPMGCIEFIATAASILLFIVTFPISLCLSFKVRMWYMQAYFLFSDTVCKLDCITASRQVAVGT